VSVMLGWLSQLFKRRKSVKITILGLDKAGKTTLVKYMKFGKAIETKTTMGVDFEQIEFEGLRLLIWDVGGQTTFRKHIWEEFLNGSDIIVYVVDSADKERLDLATEEFWRVVNLSSLKGIPVLVLANKQDLPDALDAGEIAAKMKLFQLRNRSFAVYPISALKGEGIEEAFKWVADRFK